VLTTFIIFIFGLIWGSFLNVVAYRLIQEQSLGGRSVCPHCNHQLAWYDNIPLLSWLALRGKCRTCAQPISFLYPSIELLTGVVFVLLFKKIAVICPREFVRPEIADQICEAWRNQNYSPDGLESIFRSSRRIEGLFSYFIFFSALIVTIRTDLEFMLISRYMTLFLVPLGIILSALGFLPISPLESVLCALGGYLLFYSIAQAFYRFMGREGMGQGDLDLIAFIGAFTGLMGVWMTILIGSIFGCVASGIYLLASGQERSTHIPFGPFLAFGAICYVLFAEQLMQLIA
jgi:leader peptidase (prepilin peptidase)/N-methyltransferase